MVHLVSNYAVEHFLTKFRDQDTTIYEATNCVDIISTFLAGEVSNLLNVKNSDVKTPLGIANGMSIASNIQIVPIIRAGMAMLPAFCKIFPNAITGPIWLSRNKDLSINIHGEKLQHNLKEFYTIIIDPMLATGNTADTTISLAKSRGAQNIILVSILATPLGIERITKKYDIPMGGIYFRCFAVTLFWLMQETIEVLELDRK